MSAITVATIVRGRISRGIPPSMSLDVAIGEGNRAGVVMFPRGPLPEVRAGSHLNLAACIADVHRGGVKEGEYFTGSRRHQVRSFDEGEKFWIIGIVQGGKLPLK